MSAVLAVMPANNHSFKSLAIVISLNKVSTKQTSKEADSSTIFRSFGTSHQDNPEPAIE